MLEKASVYIIILSVKLCVHVNLSGHSKIMSHSERAGVWLILAEQAGMLRSVTARSRVMFHLLIYLPVNIEYLTVINTSTQHL